MVTSDEYGSHVSEGRIIEALLRERALLLAGFFYSIGFLGAVFSPWFLGTLGDLCGLGISALYLPFSTFMIAMSALMLSRLTAGRSIRLERSVCSNPRAQMQQLRNTEIKLK